MKFAWEKQTHRYSHGEWLRVGKVVVGDAGYRTVTKGDPKTYGLTCLLPGIRQVETRYPTLDEAKARLEKMVTVWFSWVNEAQP